MGKLVRLMLLVVTVSFFVSYAAAKKPADQGGGGAKVTTEVCNMAGDVSSAGPVEVGIDVKTYGPNILLILSPSLAGSEFEGTFPCEARVLKKDGRLDFYYDGDGENPGCGGPEFKSSANVCPYRLILLDGNYDRQADTVFFGQPGRVYLYVDSLEMVNKQMGGSESVTIDFEPFDE